MFLGAGKSFRIWWPGTESNRRRQPFQGCALPTELPGRSGMKLQFNKAAVLGRSRLECAQNPVPDILALDGLHHG